MDWIHLHLALNHLPVLGTPFLLCLLLWSWGKGQIVTLRFCLWLFVALAAASIAIKFTGDFASEKLANTPAFDRVLIDRHEQSADQATAGVFFMGIAAALALFLSRGKRHNTRWALAFVALLALITFALMLRTANLGGHIRHPEIRPRPSALLSPYSGFHSVGTGAPMDRQRA
jgi:hypothetical protein